LKIGDSLPVTTDWKSLHWRSYWSYFIYHFEWKSFWYSLFVYIFEHTIKKSYFIWQYWS